jgi:DNA-nicking Smr family endonuclease
MDDDPATEATGGEACRIPIEDAIDLHPFQPRDVVDVVDEYLREAQSAGFTVVRLIHGRGKGVQRAAVQRLLESHSAVAAFWDAPEAHLGATLVKLKPQDSDPQSLAPSR